MLEISGTRSILTSSLVSIASRALSRRAPSDSLFRLQFYQTPQSLEAKYHGESVWAKATRVRVCHTDAKKATL